MKKNIKDFIKKDILEKINSNGINKLIEERERLRKRMNHQL